MYLIGRQVDTLLWKSEGLAYENSFKDCNMFILGLDKVESYHKQNNKLFAYNKFGMKFHILATAEECLFGKEPECKKIKTAKDANEVGYQIIGNKSYDSFKSEPYFVKDDCGYVRFSNSIEFIYQDKNNLSTHIVITDPTNQNNTIDTLLSKTTGHGAHFNTPILTDSFPANINRIFGKKMTASGYTMGDLYKELSHICGNELIDRKPLRTNKKGVPDSNIVKANLSWDK